MNIIETIRKFAQSKTIAGIATAGIGSMIQYGHSLLTPEMLAQYGPYIQIAAAMLQTTGLGTAVYGRIKAQGPIVVVSAVDSNKIAGA